MGRPLFVFTVLDDDGEELCRRSRGCVFWRRDGNNFEYHNDEEKTKSAMTDQGYSSLGDVGYLDDDGFLLNDRKSFMIISGGVNIYPKETEDLLVMHQKLQT